MNTCNLTGNAGKDAELRYSQSGMALCTFSLAEYKGEDKQAVWWDVVCFGETAEAVASLVKRGWKVEATGTVELDTWEKDVEESGRMVKKQFSRLKLLANAVGARPPKNATQGGGSAQGGQRHTPAANAQQAGATGRSGGIPGHDLPAADDEDPFGDQ